MKYFREAKITNVKMEGKRKYEKELAGVSDFPVKEYSVKKEKALRD